MYEDSLSIIVCTQKDVVELNRNIHDTIGSDYELIVVHNSNNMYSIFEAYNIGLSKAKNEICCFVHDDVNFRTSNWGQAILFDFKNNPKLGVLGVVGSSVKTKMPSGYNHCDERFKHYNIIQRRNNTFGKIELGFSESNLMEVATIDGVFFALKNNGILSFSGDLKGFHGYDFNISMECHKNNLQVFVTKNVLIEHQSEGQLNYDWYHNLHLLHIRYLNLLPIGRTNENTQLFNRIEKRNGYNFLKHALDYPVNYNLFFWYFKYILIDTKLSNHINLLKYFVKRKLFKINVV